ncbi:MAG: sarcosine oxidase subunit delta [Gemmatimonadaceae bacterium]|nr:sarcosine oxidase subunit delta [Gemmatimonadaceae bacterium]NUO93679.1 sarcosine oxidase subunit delta [Gemmatimonadaceae bacterium]NUS33868.1 sarcosine oxidase subunit delta [Gemmatimonadaceae bacterium]
MLLITCPWCGAREETEFRHGGEGVRVPPDGDDPGWTRLLYYRENPAGPYAERWVHVHGCRQWFHVVRDTTTHQILSTRRLDGQEGAA